MPLDPRTWTPFDPVTASRLNEDLYSHQAQAFVPNGVRFHTRRPFYKATVAPQGTPGTNMGPNAWTAPIPYGLPTSTLADTSADYGALMDNVQNGQLRGVVSYSDGASGSVTNTGGWFLVSSFVPMTSQASKACYTAIANSWVGTSPGIQAISTMQTGSGGHDITPMAIDLLNIAGGNRTFISAYNSTSALQNLHLSPDGSGEAYRLQAHWTSVDPPNGYTAAAPAPKTSWAGTDTVTAALLNGPNGIRDVLRFLNMPPSLKVRTVATTSCAAATDTLIKMDNVVIDSYKGWSGYTASTYTIPRTGLYLCYGLVPFPSSAGQAKCGIKINAASTFWGPAAPAPSNSDVAPAKLQIFDLQAGDTVQLHGWQNSGGALNTATDHDPRLIVLYLGNTGVPSPLPTVPDTSYRYQAQGGPVAALAAFNSHLANDLNFLVNKPYVTAYQFATQSVPDKTSTKITMDQLGGLIHNTNGDNYGGWDATNKVYTAQRAGWYMAVMEVFFPPATLTVKPATIAMFQHSQNSEAVSNVDWYQHSAATLTSQQCGSAALGYYYLRAGDTLAPYAQAQDMVAGSISTNSTGGAQSHFEMIWTCS